MAIPLAAWCFVFSPRTADIDAAVADIKSRQARLDRLAEVMAQVPDLEAALDEGDDWSRAVRSHCDGRGVDVCVDSIGAAVHGPALRSLARGGTLVP